MKMYNILNIKGFMGRWTLCPHKGPKVRQGRNLDL